MNTYKRHRFPPHIISYAVWLYHRLKQRHRGYGDTFYIDEVFVKINGKQHYLWRAVDQDGEVVDVYLQARRDGASSSGLCGVVMESPGTS
jgi:putative transposase